MQAIEDRHAPRPAPRLAALSAVATIEARPAILTLLSTVGIVAGLAIATLMSQDPRQAGAYAVACIMIGGAVALARRNPEATTTAVASAAPSHAASEAARREIRAVAHDLRAPLLTVSSYIDLIADGAFGSVAPEAQAALRRAATVAGRAQHLVESTLQREAIEAATAPLARVDLTAVMSDVLDALTAEMRTARASVAVEGRLPVVLGDETALFRILENVLQNSIKYARPGVPPSISVHARRLDAGAYELAVRDNGAGIHPAQADLLLLPGVRGSRAADETAIGAGLGLATVARLVAHLGGTVTLDSSRADGTTVRLTLRAA